MSLEKQPINLTAILNRMVVVVDEPITKTKSGLYIPDSAEKPRTTGVVVAKGEQCVSPVKTGDRILFQENAGQGITYQDEKYLVLVENQIIGIVPE